MKTRGENLHKPGSGGGGEGRIPVPYLRKKRAAQIKERRWDCKRKKTGKEEAAKIGVSLSAIYWLAQGEKGEIKAALTFQGDTKRDDLEESRRVGRSKEKTE